MILVAVGGSATTDGGAGAHRGDRRRRRPARRADRRADRRAHVFEDAPKVFGPQKGADPDMVVRLRERLERSPATSRATRAACR